MAFSTDDVPAPQDTYGISKMEAEAGLREIAAKTCMEVAIIRPPLVYGSVVKASFAAMMRWRVRRTPVPGHRYAQPPQPGGAGQSGGLDRDPPYPPICGQPDVFGVGRRSPLSTADLLRRMGQALGDSLQVDISKTQALLGWVLPLSVDEGLKKAAEGFLRETSV